MKRKLLYHPDNQLRQRTHEVRDFNVAELQQLAEDMRHVMKANNGMGLAAIQVGDPRRLIIIEYPGDPEANEPAIPFTILLNPRITKLGPHREVFTEGCLSVPSVEVSIERPTEVTVLAQTITGEPTRLRAKGMLARILQHEIDHLNNILIIDYAKKTLKKEGAVRTMVWGSTSFTTQFLNTILPNPLLTITHIVTEAPKPSGRGREVKPTVARQYADALGITCLEPSDLKNERFISHIRAQQPDLILVAAYGKLLPKEILEIPCHGCLNVHPSLLPRYRGSTPVQAAILNGDRKTGVTIIKMSPEFDKGEILAQSEVRLIGTETYGELESLLAEIGGEIVNEITSHYLSGHIQPISQNENRATYTKKIQSEDRWLNPEDPAILNERKVRAYAPHPGAFVILDRKMMKVLQAHVENGKLALDTVQLAGKKTVDWQAFLRGYRKAPRFGLLRELEV